MANGFSFHPLFAIRYSPALPAARALARLACRRRHHHHDDAERQHCQPHELEHQGIHGDISPDRPLDLSGGIDGLLNLLVTADSIGGWWKVS